MKLADVRKNAFAMPLNNPAYPRGPYKFYNREFMIISYRTDPDVLRSLVPEPLEPIGDTVNYKFIRMPDSTGFGDYTETGQVIPVRFTAAGGTVQEGGYVHAMYLDDKAPIAPRAKLIQTKSSETKQIQAKTLGFAWSYSDESGLFNGLQRFQIRISPDAPGVSRARFVSDDQAKVARHPIFHKRMNRESPISP
jgi:acetoacetate decarboxylase